MRAIKGVCVISFYFFVFRVLYNFVDYLAYCTFISWDLISRAKVKFTNFRFVKRQKKLMHCVETEWGALQKMGAWESFFLRTEADGIGLNVSLDTEIGLGTKVLCTAVLPLLLFAPLPAIPVMRMQNSIRIERGVE